MENKEMNLYGVTVTGDISEKEALAYIDYLQEKHNRKIESLDVRVDGEFVDLNFKFANVKFERIRRITGYLVGTMDNWNNAKAAEERDRVKHGLGSAAGSEGMEIL